MLYSTKVPAVACRCHNYITIFDIPKRPYSSPARRPNFLSQFIDNVKQDIARNKEMKESLKKFKEEAEKLEQSEALRQARRKYQAVESEASKGQQLLKERLGTLRGKVQEAIEEAGKSDIAKKAGQLSEDFGKSARGAAETIAERGQKLGQTAPFRTISETADAVRKELNEGPLSRARVYKPPVQLRMRKEQISEEAKKQFTPNTEATGVELHKDSRFYQSWQNFKDTNPVYNRVVDWKMKYDESENPVVRASRLITDKVSDIMGGLFQRTELSEVLTEICKIDPNFNSAVFLKQCQFDIIPNILEATLQANFDVLRDWCHDMPFSALSTPIKQARTAGLRIESQILDLFNVDLAMGKMMEQGPVLVISFSSQQITCVRNSKNDVVEGDPNKVTRVNYVFVLCRDQSELNPDSAWRLLDLSAQSMNQMI